MKLNIGHIIRDRRRAMDLTQEQLAERLGVTCQSVSRWENGQTYPDIEFLPVLADLFEISLDELMGRTKTAKEKRLSKLWDEGEAITDPETRFDHLARMKEEFPEQWDITHTMIRLISDQGIHGEMLYPLTQAVLENCADESIRWDVIRCYLCTAQDEELTVDFLNRYTQNMDRDSLLEQRYFRREDWERYEGIRQTNLLNQLNRLFDERLRRSYHASAADSAWAQQIALGVINLFTGYRADAGNRPASLMDTTPDLWFMEKYWLGFRLSCALAASGQEAAALDVLENTVKLMENVFSLPENTVLTYRCRTLDRMDRRVVACFISESLYCVEMEPVREDDGILRSLRIMMGWRAEDDARDFVWAFDDRPLTERDGWEWFDPIREHPRYLACEARMRALKERVSRC